MTAFGFAQKGDEMVAKQPTGKFPPSLQIEKLHSDNFVGRVGIPQDLAGIALFLSSSASAHVTGAHILLDGGYSIGSHVISAATKL